MSTFTMPAVGTPEFDQLKARWESKPVSFGQCTKIKAAFRDALALGGWRGKVGDKVADRLDYLSQRDDEGRWTKVRTDSGELTMWGAHLLIERLNGLGASPVIETTRAPKPAKGHRKVTVEAIEGDQVSGVILEHGQLIMVRTGSGVESKRVSVVGNRVTLGRP